MVIDSKKNKLQRNKTNEKNDYKDVNIIYDKIMDMNLAIRYIESIENIIYNSSNDFNMDMNLKESSIENLLLLKEKIILNLSELQTKAVTIKQRFD